jgi:hypothetical protein
MYGEWSNSHVRYEEKSHLLLYGRCKTMLEPYILEETPEEGEKMEMKQARIRHMVREEPTFFCQNIFLNKLYRAEINAGCKIVPPSAIGYRLRPLYFYLSGDKENLSIQFENGYNYFYFQDHESHLK